MTPSPQVHPSLLGREALPATGAPFPPVSLVKLNSCHVYQDPEQGPLPHPHATPHAPNSQGGARAPRSSPRWPPTPSRPGEGAQAPAGSPVARGLYKGSSSGWAGGRREGMFTKGRDWWGGGRAPSSTAMATAGQHPGVGEKAGVSGGAQWQVSPGKKRAEPSWRRRGAREPPPIGLSGPICEVGFDFELESLFLRESTARGC